MLSNGISGGERPLPELLNSDQSQEIFPCTIIFRQGGPNDQSESLGADSTQPGAGGQRPGRVRSHTQLALMNFFTKGRYSALGIGRITAPVSRAHQDRSLGGPSHPASRCSDSRPGHCRAHILHVTLAPSHIHRHIQAHISTQVRTEIQRVLRQEHIT